MISKFMQDYNDFNIDMISFVHSPANPSAKIKRIINAFNADLISKLETEDGIFTFSMSLIDGLSISKTSVDETGLRSLSSWFIPIANDSLIWNHSKWSESVPDEVKIHASSLLKELIKVKAFL